MPEVSNPITTISTGQNKSETYFRVDSCRPEVITFLPPVIVSHIPPPRVLSHCSYKPMFKVYKPVDFAMDCPKVFSEIFLFPPHPTHIQLARHSHGFNSDINFMRARNSFLIGFKTCSLGNKAFLVQ